MQWREQEGTRMIKSSCAPWATVLKGKNNARLHLQPLKPHPSHNHKQAGRACPNKAPLPHKPDGTTFRHQVSPRQQTTRAKTRSAWDKSTGMHALSVTESGRHWSQVPQEQRRQTLQLPQGICEHYQHWRVSDYHFLNSAGFFSARSHFSKPSSDNTAFKDLA